MTVQPRGPGEAEALQMGTDNRDEFDPMAVVRHVQELLTAAQVRHSLTTVQVAVVRIAAAQLLQGMNVRPTKHSGRPPED